MGQSPSSWGPGWPHGASVPVKAFGFKGRDGLVQFPAGLAAELHELVTILLAETERRGYKIHKGWCWGYANRAIAGTNIPSNHSRATAVDINAPENARGTAGKFPDRIAKEVWEACGFEWGGRWSGASQDPMHFEFMKQRSEVKEMTDKAKRLFGEAEDELSEQEKKQLAELYARLEGEKAALKGEPEPTKAGPKKAGYVAAKRFLGEQTEAPEAAEAPAAAPKSTARRTRR